MSKNIGVFGGTFDPPHLGHLILASEALRQFSLDQVLFLLTPDPPHKENRTKANIVSRIAMIRLMVNYDSKFDLSMVDLNREGPHYTVDSMRFLHEAFPNDRLTYIMGADSLQSLFSVWYKPNEFVSQCDQIGVMRRFGTELNLSELAKINPEIVDKVAVIDAPQLEISSQQIRRRIQNGGHYRYFLTDRVYRFININKLYYR